MPVYEVAEDCDAELAASLGAFTGQYDQVFARCVPVDPALEEEDAELTWDVRPDGTLIAAIEAVPADVLVADGRCVKFATHFGTKILGKK